MRVTSITCLIIIALLSSGCASVAEFPATASAVDFDGEQGHTGWAKYERTCLIREVRYADALAGAEKALSFSKFDLRKSDLAGGVVIGEHGATPYDYNIIAAIYLRTEGKDVRVRIHVQASRDIGILGDATERNWPVEIESSLRAILQRQ
jgi:hypothetical protein